MAKMVQDTRVATPHPVSRLRKAEPRLYDNDTPNEQALRARLDRDYEWHHQFWTKNNLVFKEVDPKRRSCPVA
jgi:hypothetical protein